MARIQLTEENGTDLLLDEDDSTILLDEFSYEPPELDGTAKSKGRTKQVWTKGHLVLPHYKDWGR